MRVLLTGGHGFIGGHLVRALKDGAPNLFVNARPDTYWLGWERERTVDRARRYVDAGADGDVDLNSIGPFALFGESHPSSGANPLK